MVQTVTQQSYNIGDCCMVKAIPAYIYSAISLYTALQSHMDLFGRLGITPEKRNIEDATEASAPQFYDAALAKY